MNIVFSGTGSEMLALENCDKNYCSFRLFSPVLKICFSIANVLLTATNGKHEFLTSN